MKNKCKMASMLKKIPLSGDISMTKRCFVTNFINFHYSSRPIFGSIGFKIESVVFVYELINNEVIFLLLGYVIITIVTHNNTPQ